MPERHPVDAFGHQRLAEVGEDGVPENRGVIGSAVHALAVYRDRLENGNDLDTGLPLALDNYSSDSDSGYGFFDGAADSTSTRNRRTRANRGSGTAPRYRSFSRTLRQFTRGLVGDGGFESDLDETRRPPL